MSIDTRDIVDRSAGLDLQDTSTLQPGGGEG